MNDILNNSNVRWCSNCLSMSTRNRITFNQKGICNACSWAEEKKKLDWSSRQSELNRLLHKHKSKKLQGFDCLVPVSGGKDGSYVAHQLKHKYGMNPLAVTVTPALPLELGEKNLKAFIACGYNHISVSPDYEAMRTLNKYGLIEMGFPYYGWLIAIHTAVLRIAVAFNIDLIFYGEDGEVEYGGSTETSRTPVYGIDYQKRIYLEGGYAKVLNAAKLSQEQLYFFEFPEDKDFIGHNIEITHWSYFENWDPYRNYLIAKEHCGLSEAESANVGTFTNFSQNDQALYALHTYLMYLKFGFGRANQDACIEIRRGSMDRDQAVNLVNMYDGRYPLEYEKSFLEYYQLTLPEFKNAIERWVNKDLFEARQGRWVPKFKVL